MAVMYSDLSVLDILNLHSSHKILSNSELVQGFYNILSLVLPNLKANQEVEDNE